GTGVARLRSRWCGHHRPLTPEAGIAPRQEELDVARRLTQSLSVFDERDADIAFAVLAESDARRHRDIGLLEQQLGESQAAHLAEALGQRRPGEHAGGRARYLPAGLAQAFD